jgi:ubiquitin carboxyl-terminal hydrolase 5/13
MSNENTLTLPILVEKATNTQELEQFEKVKEAEKDKKESEKTPHPKAVVPFELCCEEFLKDEIVEGFLSPATNTRGNASKRTRLVNFPPYLVVKLRRYVLGSDWTPKKLDAKVNVPQRFDFSAFRGSGIQPHEQELPKSAEAVAPQMLPDQSIVDQLVLMGFSENGSKRAVSLMFFFELFI